VSRRGALSAAVLAAALLLAILAIVRLQSRPQQAPSSSGAVLPQAAPGPESPGGAGTDGEEAVTEPLQRLQVVIYFPAVETDGLIGEPHEIFRTAAPGDRAKQIIADLISGPTGEGLLRALPPGTHVRQVFVLEDGTAYLDFSADLRQGIRGGSTEELLAVYAIVNSVALNVPEIRRLGILIDGRPVETLNGHVDLRRPLPPDPSWVVSGTVEIVRDADREAILR
jgi:spore germination protein GerM